MITRMVAFGERVALLHRVGLPAGVPVRILLPGDGRSVRERARTAVVRPDRPARVGRAKRRPGGRTILTPACPGRIVLPGQPTRSEEVRSRCFDVDPAPIDLAAARRHGGFGDEADVWRYESIVDQGY
ncbi:hypothetical protein ABIB25_001371 [Nakamurella sp. UYEF19]|uniref:hypothetical protein n=1 Tax=Nakamurella sp. UYEF19 TaxID=1756392 RepID=UPI003398A439